MKPYIVAAIFARGGSKGVPRKNIRPLAGKPLIAYSIEVARSLRCVDRVIVSTDDAEIAEVAKKFGAEVPFLRPPDLAQDNTPEWLAWRHALQTLQSPNAPKIDVMVSIPTTSPLRRSEDVQSCIDRLLATEADAVITIKETDRNPYFNMVTLDGQFSAKRVISPEKTIHRRQDAPKVYDMTTVAYALKTNFIFNKNSLFEGHIKAVIVPAERAIDIDTEFDFKLAEFLMRKG